MTDKTGTIIIIVALAYTLFTVSAISVARWNGYLAGTRDMSAACVDGIRKAHQVGHGVVR